MARQYRQGDILLQRVRNLPEDAVPEIHHNRVILALGEATGHAHAFAPMAVAAYAADDKRFVVVQKEFALLEHEEHRTLRIDKGTYEIVRQREYAPSREVKYVYVDD